MLARDESIYSCFFKSRSSVVTNDEHYQEPWRTIIDLNFPIMYTLLWSEVDSGRRISHLEEAELTLNETKILWRMLLLRVGGSTLLTKSKITSRFEVLNILKPSQIRMFVMIPSDFRSSRLLQPAIRTTRRPRSFFPATIPPSNRVTRSLWEYLHFFIWVSN